MIERLEMRKVTFAFTFLVPAFFRIKWLIHTFFSILILTFSLTSFGEPVMLTQQSLKAQLGEKWEGLIYVCSPYCAFLSVVVGGVYAPAVIPTKMEPKELKLILSTDPIYPLLIQKLPVLPHLQALARQKAGKEKPEDEIKVPAYAVVPYDFAYAIEAGGFYRNMKVQSNTEIQRNWTPKGSLAGYALHISLIKGKPISFFRQYFQIQIDGDYLKSLSFKTATSPENSWGTTQLQLLLWWMRPGYRLGLGLGQWSENWSTLNMSLSQYPMSRSMNMLSLNFALKNGLSVQGYLPMSIKIKEELGFREAPLKDSYFRIQTKYCSKNFSLADMDFGLCSQLGYSMDNQTASVNTTLLNQQSTTRKETNIDAMILLRIGEDLWH